MLSCTSSTLALEGAPPPFAMARAASLPPAGAPDWLLGRRKGFEVAVRSRIGPSERFTVIRSALAAAVSAISWLSLRPVRARAS